jgi:hypothetical protein
MMNRRGFLSLVGTGAAALAIEKALPPIFKPAVARGRVRQLADGPTIERY